MRNLPLLLAPMAILAGCAPVEPYVPTPEAQAELNALIAGKTPGQPMSCLRPYQSDRMVTIDDNTIAFRDGSTVYVSRAQSGCDGLDTGFYTLVTKSTGGGMCAGDIAQVVDLTSGITVGSCVFGDFTPYRAP